MFYVETGLACFSYLSESQSTAVATPAWRNAPIPDASPGRWRNVSRLRAMGGDPTCVPPDFNSSMLAVWEELWHPMPRVAGLVLLCTTCFSATKSAIVQRGSGHDTHQRALQPCYQCHLHRLRISCSGSRSRSARPSRLVWSMKKLVRLLLSSIAPWLNNQHRQLYSWSSQPVQPLQWSPHQRCHLAQSQWLITWELKNVQRSKLTGKLSNLLQYLAQRDL